MDNNRIDRVKMAAKERMKKQHVMTQKVERVRPIEAAKNAAYDKHSIKLSNLNTSFSQEWSIPSRSSFSRLQDAAPTLKLRPEINITKATIGASQSPASDKVDLTLGAGQFPVSDEAYPTSREDQLEERFRESEMTLIEANENKKKLHIEIEALSFRLREQKKHAKEQLEEKELLLSNAIEVKKKAQKELGRVSFTLCEHKIENQRMNDELLGPVQNDHDCGKELRTVRLALNEQAAALEMNTSNVLRVISENESLKKDLTEARNKLYEGHIQLYSLNRAKEELSAIQTTQKRKIMRFQSELESMQRENIHLAQIETKLADVAECPICTKFIEKTAVLTCGHTFCQACIISWKEESDNERQRTQRPPLSNQEHVCLLCHKIGKASRYHSLATRDAFALVKGFVQRRYPVPIPSSVEIIDVDAINDD